LATVIRDTAWVFVGQVAGRGLLFLTGAALAWKLGAGVFGDFSYLALTSATLTTYFSVGAGTAIIRHVATRSADTRAERAPHIAAAALIALTGGGAAVLLIIALPGLFLPAAVGHLQIPLICALCAQLLSGLASSVLTGERNFAAIAGANVAAGLILMLTALAGALINAPLLIVWSIPVSQLALLVVLARAALPCLSGDMDLLSRANVIASIMPALRFSGPVFLLSVLATTGPWVLGMLLLRVSRGEFAAYSAGLQWFSLVLVIPGALSSAYLPRLFREAAAPAVAASALAIRTVRANTLQSLTLAALIAGVLLPLAGILTRLHGDVLRGRQGVFAAFMLAAVLSAVTNPIGNGMVANERQLRWLGLTALWLLTILGAAFAAPISTALGVALDMCVGYALLLLLALSSDRWTQASRLPACQPSSDKIESAR
jgi:O-antigen/teichoic acid export membrane protein